MGSKPLKNVDEEFFGLHMQMNVKAPSFLAKAAMEHLPTRGSTSPSVLTFRDC
jgi:3-oxoacyl-[acyl-carrier protein] reductase